MVATEPNIKTLSKSFLTYSFPKNEKRKEAVVPNDLIQQLTIRVNQLSEALKSKQERMEKMISILEQITWVSNPDAEAMNLIEGIVKDTIAYLDIEESFISEVKPLAAKGYVKKEFNSFIGAYDDLKEALLDIKSVFYTLPEDKEFYAAFKKLEGL
ncbi:hypothetical protein [Dyadobacter sp. CY312]|uniref:hypothetical protein n=1 Tax=Dyadobacter sp. CY312 TaxID=2907303 RepID=UPI001F2212BB|nr:hypothetical protein [Dyadobacter sp. CY312]MCE7044552.1 hypothetical protein [Dyadobacter sp. CY312]